MAAAMRKVAFAPGTTASYTQPGWPTDANESALFDPLWGLVDPAAGAWFPQQALDLAKRANPALLP